jgi:hypothetical protein
VYLTIDYGREEMLREKTKIHPTRMVLAILLSVAMLLTMTPVLAHADGTTTASEDAAGSGSDSGAAKSAKKSVAPMAYAFDPPGAESRVTTWTEFRNAWMDARVSVIRVMNDISKGTTTGTNLPALTRSLKIVGDGSARSIDFGPSSSANAMNLGTKAASSPATLGIYNIKLSSSATASQTALVRTDAAAAGWTIILSDVSRAAGSTTVALLVNVPTGKVILDETVNWPMSGSYASYDSRGVVVTTAGYSFGAITAADITVTEGANVTFTGGSIALYAKNAGKVTFEKNSVTNINVSGSAIHGRQIEFKEGAQADFTTAARTVINITGSGTSYFKAQPGAYIDLTNTWTGDGASVESASGADDGACPSRCIGFNKIRAGDIFEVDGATVTGVSNGNASEGMYGGVYSFKGTGLKINIKNAGKLIGTSNGGMAAFVSDVPSGTITVDGLGSLIELTSYRGLRWIAATMRFRAGSNQAFNITNYAEVHITKGYYDQGKSDTTTHPAVGVQSAAVDTGQVAALRLGIGANKSLNVSGGGKLYVVNKGNGRVLDPGDTDGNNLQGGWNAGVEIGDNNFNFNVSGKDSIISLVADSGAAFNAYTKSGVNVTVDKGASFVAAGKTKTYDAGTFRASGGKCNFDFDNVGSLDFRNNRAGGGQLFRTGTDSVINSVNSEISLWHIGTDLEDGPGLYFPKINYRLSGINFGTVTDSNWPGFAEQYGQMTNYSRMSGNNETVFSLGLDRSGTYTFAGANAGYGAQTPLTAAVVPYGTGIATNVDIALSGPDAGRFTLDPRGMTETIKGSADTPTNVPFTIVPKTGLAARDQAYTATVTLTGDNGIHASFDVSFKVSTGTGGGNGDGGNGDGNGGNGSGGNGNGDGTGGGTGPGTGPGTGTGTGGGTDKVNDGSGNTPDKVQATSTFPNVVKIRTPLKTIYLTKNKKYKIPFVLDTVKGKPIKDSKLKVTTSNPKVAKVSKSGTSYKIKALKKGKATVTINAQNGKKVRIKVVVQKKKIALKKFKAKMPKKLKKGKTYQIKISKLTKKASNISTVTFKSSKKKIATVDKAGKITALKKGKVKITVKVGKKKISKVIRIK